MLIGFMAENFKSFFGETTLSMAAASDKEHRGFNVIPNEHGDLLKNILIYGANASGKSNLIHALHYMKTMASSAFDVQTELIKACQPFTFNNAANGKPTRFELSFLIDGVVYEYGFDILKGQINSEYLYKKAKRRTLVFERSAPGYESIRTIPDMADVEPLKKNVRGDVLFLTWAAYANNALAIKIVDWISNKLIIFGFNGHKSVPADSAAFLQDFVQKSDSGILQMKQDKGGELLSSHRVFDEGWSETATVDVPFSEYSSDGTKRMFGLGHVFYKALKESAAIIIDELDLHLHPALVRHLISLVNSVEHNPNGAQLICTTHDVLLLDEDVRRDQIWFVDKDGHGVSTLYALSDFKDVRKNSDILKRYLLGVYGAIPHLRGDGNA
jgi:AAA15 family ATPase/GTPase